MEKYKMSVEELKQEISFLNKKEKGEIEDWLKSSAF